MRRTFLPVMVVALAGVAVAGPSASEIKKAMKSGDKATVEKALAELKGNLDKNAVKAVLDSALEVKPLGVYDQLVATLGSASGEALTELCDAATDNKRPDIRFVVVDALGKCADKSAEAALVGVLEKEKDESVVVLAARTMGKRGTASAVEALIPPLAKIEKDAKQTRLIREVNGALAALTGQDISVAADWKNYWDAHKAEFVAKPDVPDDGKTHARDENALDRMKRERPADARTVSRLKDDDVVVIKGKSDKVEQVLDALKIKHVEHERGEFDKVTLDPDRQLLVLNCASKEELTEGGIAKVREFVAKGGYVFSSDWELGHTLAKAFPEACAMAKQNGKDDIKVKIAPNKENASHPFLRDVFPLGTWTETPFTWTIDSRSHMIKPNPALVVLVESSGPEIDALGTNIVAVTFSYTMEGGQPRVVTGKEASAGVATGGGSGKRRIRGGTVVHVLSHFKNQKDASGDGFALQQLLLNFIVEKQEAAREAAIAKRSK